MVTGGFVLVHRESGRGLGGLGGLGAFLDGTDLPRPNLSGISFAGAGSGSGNTVTGITARNNIGAAHGTPGGTANFDTSEGPSDPSLWRPEPSQALDGHDFVMSTPTIGAHAMKEAGPFGPQ